MVRVFMKKCLSVLNCCGLFNVQRWLSNKYGFVSFFAITNRTHPYFISIEAYKELVDATKLMGPVKTADWVTPTIASWRHSIWVGIYDPRGFIFKPTKYLKCARDAYCLERMHRAFDRGLMQYGMFAATKAKQDD